jgi:hypothetical protein
MKRPRSGTPRRVPGKREQLRVIRVLTEGTVTEPGYLVQWARRNHHLHIDFADSGMAPLTMVQQARHHQQTNRRSNPNHRGKDFDEIWCVFDVDQHPNLSQAINEARQSDINVALSNPCFELWLILHYQDQTAHIERHDAQRRAHHLGAVDAKRLNPANIDTLFKGYDDAKLRAQTLQARHITNGSGPETNPSSNVWELIDRLR